jgi:hypothetical protein
MLEKSNFTTNIFKEISVQKLKKLPDNSFPQIIRNWTQRQNCFRDHNIDPLILSPLNWFQVLLSAQASLKGIANFLTCSVTSTSSHSTNPPF